MRVSNSATLSNRLRCNRVALLATVLTLVPPHADAQEVMSPGSRIVGGEPTTIAEHPWQVAVLLKSDGKTFLCSGSIVARRWVLTAAHCLEKIGKPTDVQVKAGVDDWQTQGHWVEVCNLIVHGHYNSTTNENDLALLQTGEDLDGKTIPLASPSQTPQSGENLEVAGWGVTEAGALSRELRKVTVPYVGNDTCNARKSYNGRILPTMLCAGRREGGADACQGDSGGPLVRYTDGAVLVGIVSRGQGCALKMKYGIYTRVTNYRKWINDAIVGPVSTPAIASTRLTKITDHT
jgi:secreted trypsin-like serine protease